MQEPEGLELTGCVAASLDDVGNWEEKGVGSAPSCMDGMAGRLLCGCILRRET